MQARLVVAMRKEDGFTLIDVLFVVALIGVLMSISLPALARAKGNAQAVTMLADLHLLNSAQLSYAVTCGSGFYAPDLPTLGLIPVGSTEGFVNAELSSGVVINRRGYTLMMEGIPLAGSPAGCSGAAPGSGAPTYRAATDSISPTNPRFFATNANGIIFEHSASLWGVMPESGNPPVGSPIQ